MKTNFIRQNVFPVLAALIWGLAFVAQSVGADMVGPFTFNAARAFIGFLFLLVICVALRVRNGKSACKKTYSRQYYKDLVIGGICCGIALTLAVNLQQKGLETTTSGKAGFITALYIVLVPIAGLFLKKKAPRLIWLSVVIAVAGLYFLSISGAVSVTVGDLYMLVCALCFTGHILVIDNFTNKVSGIELSCVQFLVVSLISAVGMLATETPSWEGIVACAVPLLYVGILSSGVGYTLQILAQKDSNPTVVSLLMSLESVFATVFGALILHEAMSGREYFGCLLMLIAVVLAQLPDKSK